VKLTMRKGFRLGLVAGLVATGLVGVTSLTASGSGSPSMVDYGTLELSLNDRSGTLTLFRENAFGGGTFTQALGVADPCSTLVAGPIVPAGTGSLLTFSAAVTGGSSPNVQLPSNGIGVTDGANCGVPAGLVGPGETLILGLGGFLPTDVIVSDAKLQIGKSQRNDGNLKVAYDGSNTFVDPNFPSGNLEVGVTEVTVAKPGGFRSISLRSTANQSSRGLSLRSDTAFTLMAPAPVAPTAPGAPTITKADSGDQQATIEWTGPTETGGSQVTGYVLRYYPTGDPNAVTEETFDDATTDKTVTDLINGTSYTFEVSATNVAGEGPAATATVTPAKAPGAPTITKADSGDQQATIEWTGPTETGGSQVTGYVLRYYPTGDPNAVTEETFDDATTDKTVTDLINGTSYTFEVSATNVAGEGPAATATVTPAKAPGAPTITKADSGDQQATIEWTGPTETGGSQVTGYVLRYYPTGDPNAVTEETFDDATTDKTVTDLINGTSYTFEVSATNVAGEGPAATATVTPLPGTTKPVDCIDGFEVTSEGDIATSALFFRGENGVKDPEQVPDPCQKVNATVAIVDGPGDNVLGGEINDFVYWDNETADGNGFVQATITIKWAAISPANANIPTQIDYDGFGPGGFVDAQWCVSFTEGEPGPEGQITGTGVLPAYSGDGNINGTAPWCLVRSTEVLIGGGVFRTDVFYGSGDPKGATIR
jgi:hypothetical protein